MSQPTELTVDELKDLLEKMSAAGHGNDKVVIPYTRVGASIGARPAVAITGGQTGIDWDSGKLFLQPSKELGIPDADILAKAQKAERELGHIQFLAGRLGSERGGSLEEQIAQFQASLGALKPATPRKTLK